MSGSSARSRRRPSATLSGGQIVQVLNGGETSGLRVASGGSAVVQAGGLASRNATIVNPQDAKGLKIRGGSREMDMVFQAAGATTLTTPSNELYAAMQTGACDAA